MFACIAQLLLKFSPRLRPLCVLKTAQKTMKGPPSKVLRPLRLKRAAGADLIPFAVEKTMAGRSNKSPQKTVFSIHHIASRTRPSDNYEVKAL